MRKVNQLVLCRDNYKNQEEFECEIKKVIMILLNADYIMTIKYDEKELGIIVIEYNYAELEFGDRYPCWLYPQEEESVVWQES